jgi:hypothetical protein
VWWFLGVVFWCIVLVILNAILVSVGLKRLVILLILELWYVKVAHFFLYWMILVASLLCIFNFSFLMMGIGKLLLFATLRIVRQSASTFSGERDKDVI